LKFRKGENVELFQPLFCAFLLTRQHLHASPRNLLNNYSGLRLKAHIYYQTRLKVAYLGKPPNSKVNLGLRKRNVTELQANIY